MFLFALWIPHFNSVVVSRILFPSRRWWRAAWRLISEIGVLFHCCNCIIRCRKMNVCRMRSAQFSNHRTEMKALSEKLWLTEAGESFDRNSDKLMIFVKMYSAMPRAGEAVAWKARQAQLQSFTNYFIILRALWKAKVSFRVSSSNFAWERRKCEIFDAMIAPQACRVKTISWND